MLPFASISLNTENPKKLKPENGGSVSWMEFTLHTTYRLLMAGSKKGVRKEIPVLSRSILFCESKPLKAPAWALGAAGKAHQN